MTPTEPNPPLAPPPGGEAMTCLGIGELRVAAASSSPLVRRHLRERYRHFVVSEPAAFRLELESLRDTASAARFLEVAPGRVAGLVRPDRSWQRQGPAGPDDYAAGRPVAQPGLRLPPGGVSRMDSRPEVFRDGGRIGFRRRDFVGWVDLAARSGRVVFAEALQDIAVESFLRIAYSLLAVAEGGLLLHAAAVLRHSPGWLFPGISGTGKSTIAGLAMAGDTVLSDEMVLVRRAGAGYRVYSSPFYGTNQSTDVNVGAPLMAAFLPMKDTEARLASAGGGRSLAKLMASVLFFDQDPAANERLMDIASDVARVVPFFDLHFRRDRAFWACIDELEQKESAPC